MTSKHTPGPWRYDRNEKPGYAPHSYVWGPSVSVHCAGGHLDEVELDMLLIAAAPEMLEALIVLHQRLEQLDASGDAGRMVEDEVEIARAAIAKATGQ